MVADLREMQENQWVSEIWIDKYEFVETGSATRKGRLNIELLRYI